MVIFLIEIPLIFFIFGTQILSSNFFFQFHVIFLKDDEVADKDGTLYGT